jgi:hypothetical protein
MIHSLAPTRLPALSLALALAAGALPACAEDEPAVGLAGAGGGVAVVGSDYTSTVISLVDPAIGMVVRDRCFHSGSVSPQLSAALSGDVTLPSEPQPGHELLVIDRKNGTLTWLDADTCEVLRQMTAGDGFSANPQDVVAGPGNKAYVTRYDRNAGRPDEGSDLLVIDRVRALPLGRIALPQPATSGLPAGTTVSPRPSRALRIGDKLYVALNNLSDDFEAAAPGRIAVIDTASDRVVASIDLPELKNCGALTRAPGQGGREALVVGCTGVYSDGPRQIETAGFAWVDLDVSPPAVRIVSSRVFGRPVSGSIVAVVSADLAFTVLAGDLSGSTADAVWAFDFRGGPPRKLREGGGSFVLSLALDRMAGRLYVLDAEKTQPRVHTFNLLPDGTTAPSGSFVASPATGLPPRHLGFY